MHATNHIRKQCHHVIVAHGHVGHNLFECNLLRRIVLVLLAPTVELQSQLCDLALYKIPVSKIDDFVEVVGRRERSQRRPESSP